MRLSDLAIIHTPKPGGTPAAGSISAEAFLLDSCLRRVWIQRWNSETELAEGVRTGAEAYAFLLRLICGLESRILGETDIFGQFKEAWKTWSADPANSEA